MLTDKTVVLGITGSIAAYKAADIASRLTKAGAQVNVVMTASSQRFISPLTIQSLTRRAVADDMWRATNNFSITHVSFAQSADCVLIAPATANIIAKIAHGIADDLLSSVVLATRAPIIIAPAMNTGMYENVVTQENLRLLKMRGFTIVEPEVGRLACDVVGKGCLAGVDSIIDTVFGVLGRKKELDGKKVVVTAGGTREPIDPVRFLGNRSSGKMGYALAEAARDRGASVVLVSASQLPKPSGLSVVEVETAAQMLKAVKSAVEDAHVLIMAAAVADYSPTAVAGTKIKKESQKIVIELERTEDILGTVSGGFIKIGFAAETDNLLHNARKKLVEKDLDLVVANDVTINGSGFGSDMNRVILISREGQEVDCPLMPKREIADKICDWVVAHI